MREARKQFVDERINERFKAASALSQQSETDKTIKNPNQKEALSNKDKIETTQDEIDGYNIIKAILYEVIDVDRIAIRDTQSYCGILLDDNNRKPICRLRFNRSQKYLGLFSNNQEERIVVNDISEIYKYSDKIKKTIFEYESNKSPQKAVNEQTANDTTEF